MLCSKAVRGELRKKLPLSKRIFEG
jgi:hypothetical protein